MNYSDSWIKRTAVDYDMEEEEVRNIAEKYDNDDIDVYEELESFIKYRSLSC